MTQVTLKLDNKSDGQITVSGKLCGERKVLMHGEDVVFDCEDGKRLLALDFIVPGGGEVECKIELNNAERFNGDKYIEHGAEHDELLPLYIYIPNK